MSNTSFDVEIWTEYGIGMLIFILRFLARWKVVGIKNFQADDYFALAGMIIWSVDSAFLYLLGEFGTFVGLNEETAEALDEKTVQNYTAGSKILFATWFTYLSVIWCMKGVLLSLYSRITPIHKNWQVKPYAGDACTLTILNYVLFATLNIITDIGILAIPLPLIFQVKIPFHRKLIIALLLCSGIFVICAALLRAVLSIQAIHKVTIAALWAARETFVSAVATSLPAIKPLFTHARWIKSWKSNSNSNTKSHPKTSKFPWSKSGNNTTTITSKMGKPYELSSANANWSSAKKAPDGLDHVSETGSEEYIMQNVDAGIINRTIEVHVTTETARDESRSDLGGSPSVSDDTEEGRVADSKWKHNRAFGSRNIV
ncbi:MAG: hypothetical protein M1834_001700 [Cirrosporium novae-zelandiae]|nr:MAG: hypothetical protein M1834_001700 [Cirrosporium novae-zelandiae]